MLQSTTIIESSQQDFSDDIVDNRLIFNKKIALFFCSASLPKKRIGDYPKQELVFNVMDGLTSKLTKPTQLFDGFRRKVDRCAYS